MARMHKEDLNGAVADFSQIIALKPRDALAYSLRGATKIFQGELDSAMADANRAIELDRRLSQAYGTWGRFGSSGANSSRRWPIAIRRSNWIQKIAINYSIRSRAKVAKGDAAGAIADCNRALQIQPRFGSAFYERGRAKVESGDLAGAMTDYDQAIALNPAESNYDTSRATLKQINGDSAGAIADAERALRLDLRNALAYVSRKHGQVPNGRSRRRARRCR